MSENGDDLATILPTSVLKFEIDEASGEYRSRITVKNRNDFPLAFKVKLTNRSRYLVRPNMAILNGNAFSDISITLLGDEAEQVIQSKPGVSPVPLKGDKFLVLCVALDDTLPVEGISETELAEVWNDPNLRSTRAKLKSVLIPATAADANAGRAAESNASAEGDAPAAGPSGSPADAEGDAADRHGAAGSGDVVQYVRELERQAGVAPNPNLEEALAAVRSATGGAAAGPGAAAEATAEATAEAKAAAEEARAQAEEFRREVEQQRGLSTQLTLKVEALARENKTLRGEVEQFRRLADADRRANISDLDEDVGMRERGKGAQSADKDGASDGAATAAVAEAPAQAAGTFTMVHLLILFLVGLMTGYYIGA